MHERIASYIQQVAGSFLYREGRYLLLHRTRSVKTYSGHWCCVSGKSEPGEPVEYTAVREIEEETGVPSSHLRLLHQGEPFPVLTETWRRRITPFVFAVHASCKIRLNDENSAIRWINPWQLSNYRVVPCLQDILLRGGLPDEALQAVKAVKFLSLKPADMLHPKIVRRLEELAAQWPAVDLHEVRRRLELAAWGMAGDTAGSSAARLQVLEIYEACVRDRIKRLRK